MKPIPALAFEIVDFARPQAGGMLFAFTQAVIDMTGVMRNPVSRDLLISVWGPTAVTYHTKNGNLEGAGSGHVMMSSKGKLFFQTRKEQGKIDADRVKAYMDVMAYGQLDYTLGIKSKQAIRPAPVIAKAVQAIKAHVAKQDKPTPTLVSNSAPAPAKPIQAAPTVEAKKAPMSDAERARNYRARQKAKREAAKAGA